MNCKYTNKKTASAITLTDNESDFFKVHRNYPAIKFISYYYDKQNHLLFIDKEISLKEIYLENIYSI